MDKSCNRFKSNLIKTSVIVTAGVITYSMAYSSELSRGEKLEIDNNQENGSFIQDKVTDQKDILGIETTFYRKNNELRFAWESVEKAKEYKIYKIKNKNLKNVFDSSNLELLSVVSDNEAKVENVFIEGSPKVTAKKQGNTDAVVNISMPDIEKEYAIYIEAIDGDKNILAKSDISSVVLGDKVKGYSYKISKDKDTELDSRVDIENDEKLKIKLSEKNKYIHVKAVYESGVCSEVTVYELPLKTEEKKDANDIKVSKNNRADAYDSKKLPSEWTNGSVEINILANSENGLKLIKKPNGTVEEIGVADLKLAGGDKLDVYTSVKSTVDGGFVVSGKSKSTYFEERNSESKKKFAISNNGDFDGVVAKYSKNGEMEMIFNWGTSKADVFYDVTEVVVNGIVKGYMAVGEITQSNGKVDGLVVMFDENGKHKWNDVIVNKSSEKATINSVIQDSNGNLVVGGSSGDNEKEHIIRVYKYNSSNPKKRVYGEKSKCDEKHLKYEKIERIIEVKDGGYIAVGSRGGYDSSVKCCVGNEGIVIKYDKNFKLQWSKTFGKSGSVKNNVFLKDAVVVSDGDVVVTGYGSAQKIEELGGGSEKSKGGSDAFLIKYNSKTGDIKWKTRFGGSKDEQAYSVSELLNGDLMVMGMTKSANGDFSDISNEKKSKSNSFVMTFNGNTGKRVGAIENIGYSESDLGLSACVLKGGRIVVVGQANSKDSIGSDGFISLPFGTTSVSLMYEVDENGEYEFEFTDRKNKKNVHVVSIDNIDKESPSVRTYRTNKKDGVYVNIDVTDYSGIKSKKWSVGKKDIEYFEDNGNELKNGQINDINEKIYTIYLVDLAGNEKVEVVEINDGQKVKSIVVNEVLKKGKNSDLASVKNNSVTSRWMLDSDFSIHSDVVLDSNGYAQSGPLEVGHTYRYRFQISNPDTTPFIKTFGGTGGDHFEKHIITSDGGILAVGRANSDDVDLHGWNGGGHDGIIVKYDQYGEIEWRDSYKGPENEFLYHVVEVSDGYVAVGSAGNDNVMVKYNKSNGKRIKERRYSDNGVTGNRILIVRADANDNLYLAESIGANTSAGTKGPVYAKYDKNWNLVWRKYLHLGKDSGATTIYGLDFANNGDLLISGKYTLAQGDFAGMPNKGGTEAFVLRARSTNGTVKWMKGISGSGHDDGRQAVELDDGSVIAIGRTVSNDGDFDGKKKPLSYQYFNGESIAADSYYRGQDGWVARLSGSTGNIQQLKVIGGGGYDNLRYLMKMKNGDVLISGDTASTDGDIEFRNRDVKDYGYSDAIWIKMDKYLNIKWLSVIGGNKDDATQSGIELSEGSIVVAGETQSSSGHFKGLDKGGKDGFIARLNEDGGLEMYPHDENISSVRYNFTWSNGSSNYPAKSGSLYDVGVRVGRTITKEVSFDVPRNPNIKSMNLSAEILDSGDADYNNNYVSKSMKVVIPRDYLFAGYNVKEKGKSALVGTLRKNTEYEWNLKLQNKYIGYSKSVEPRSTYMPRIDSLKYKIVCTDGLNPQDVNSITLNNVKGTVIAQGEKKDIYIADRTTKWDKISFKTLDDESMSELILVAEIEPLDDGNLNNNRFVVKLPILNKVNPDVTIGDVSIYPNGMSNSEKLLIGNEMNVKVTLNANTLRTHDVDVDLRIEDGKDKVSMSKKVFGVSKEHPGVVYFKYKPKGIDGIKVVAEVNTVGGKKVSKPVYATVSKSEDVSKYDAAANKSKDKYNIASSVVTYLRLQKRDKDILKIRYCSSSNSCQEDNANGKLSCPGHEYFDWGQWYNAYIPRKTTKLNGLEESYDIKKVLFRSKATENMKHNNVGNINEDGTIDLMNEEQAEYALVKAGYGFEMNVETQYTNNLPKLLRGASISNTAPSDTRWSNYKIIPHASANIPFVYYSNGLNGADADILSWASKGVVSFTVPTLDDIIIENPDQLYIKMPKESYVMVDEGYGEKYGDNVSTLLEVTDASKREVVGDTYYDTKQVKFKEDPEDKISKRNYYLGVNAKDGKYKVGIFNRYSGYGITNSNKLHVKKEVGITVKGSRYDDIVDMSQE